ncbi:hypothetical protein Goshw_012043 [Gossypium schwendimanii]|uniref:DUF4283 domain-containing protein n=1 Tax=Gossypium schwendimanii TaxID=34291 RepID=A0A7J9KSF2_GOSSC|nr:hypothetical protein [Gossypium schwendimanii]
MEEDIAGLTLQDDEDDTWLVDSGASEPVARFDFYLGISISDLGEKRFLFWSYVEVDIARVIQGSPWTFSNHLLVFHRLEKGEDPLQVLLYYVDFWVQVHDLPVGFYNEQLARRGSNEIGCVLEGNTTSTQAQTSVWLCHVHVVGVQLSRGLQHP